MQAEKGSKVSDNMEVEELAVDREEQRKLHRQVPVSQIIIIRVIRLSLLCNS